MSIYNLPTSKLSSPNLVRVTIDALNTPIEVDLSNYFSRDFSIYSISVIFITYIELNTKNRAGGNLIIEDKNGKKHSFASIRSSIFPVTTPVVFPYYFNWFSFYSPDKLKIYMEYANIQVDVAYTTIHYHTSDFIDKHEIIDLAPGEEYVFYDKSWFKNIYPEDYKPFGAISFSTGEIYSEDKYGNRTLVTAYSNRTQFMINSLLNPETQKLIFKNSSPVSPPSYNVQFYYYYFHTYPKQDIWFL